MYKTLDDIQKEIQSRLTPEITKAVKRARASGDMERLEQIERAFRDIHDGNTMSSKVLAESMPNVYLKIHSLVNGSKPVEPVYEELRKSCESHDAYHKMDDNIESIYKDVKSLLAKLPRWYKSRGLLRSDTADVSDYIWEIRPDLAFIGEATAMLPGYSENVAYSVSKESWIDVFGVVLAIGRLFLGYDGLKEFVTFKEDENMLSIVIATTIILHLVVLCQIDSSIPDDFYKSLERKEETIKTLEEKLSAVGSTYKDYESQIDKLKRERDSTVAAAVGPLQKRIESLQDECDSLRQELDAVNALRRVEEQMEEVLVRLEDMPTDKLMPLPTEGVTFVGGHPAFRKKLALRFPGWNIMESNVTGNWGGRVLFLYTESISHKCFWNIRANYGGPVLYCCGSNMDIVERCMRIQYTDYCQKNGVPM